MFVCVYVYVCVAVCLCVYVTGGLCMWLCVCGYVCVLICGVCECACMFMCVGEGMFV